VERPDDPAYLSGDRRVSWREYDEQAERLAAALGEFGLARGRRLAVLLPDGPDVHAAYAALERRGLIAVGIPIRAGTAELGHILRASGASALVCAEQLYGRDPRAVLADLGSDGAAVGGLLRLDPHGGIAGLDGFGEPPPGEVGGALTTTELWLLNSTSGTTGRPKCVRQTQDRWFYLLSAAVPAGRLSADDVLMSLVPTPFGFGLWSSHFAPALLGAPCVLQERFDPAAALRAVERHKVSVLACVTTQFRLMLGCPELDSVDLSSLRVMFTGGEAVPADRAAEWERRTGSTVLQFYGSNEAGPLACTSLDDPEAARLGSVGRVVPGLSLRLRDPSGRDVTAAGGPGQPACSSPGTRGAGYFGAAGTAGADAAADAELLDEDGFVRMPDLVTVDAEGYVRVVGRTSDLVIRGGKNISAAVVEDGVGRHPAIETVAVVPAPDPVFGERVCAVVTVRHGRPAPSIDDLVELMRAHGTGPEYLPEYLVVLPELPRSIGEKVAKSVLRERLPELLPSAQTTIG
jgi:acyl-CoA synthetase